MNDFISTSGGKIVNVNAIAFLTSRTKGNTTDPGGDQGAQLVIGFSAAASIGQGSLMPLSLVMHGNEAIEFLGHLEKRGVNVEHLRHKIS